MPKINIHQTTAIDQLFRKNRVDPSQLRLFRSRFYKNLFVADWEKLKAPAEVISGLKEQVELHSLELKKISISKTDGASKLLFKTKDNHFIESVILKINTGRNTLCVSSQIGCRMGCNFCATSTLGFTRNLSTAEILDQVIQAAKILAEKGERIRNVVFMGMGEPLDNYKNVSAAIKLLLSPNGFYLSPKQVSISTAGLLTKFLKLATKFPDLSLALSLHFTDDNNRSNLMPVNKGYSIAKIKEALIEIDKINPKRPVMIEYILFENLNDTVADADRLLELVQDLNVMVNLIEYNQVDHTTDFKRADRSKLEMFHQKLTSAGIKTTRRYSLGQDIDAACGQLALKQTDRT